MLLAYFYDKKLQDQLIMEKPLAVILDNYSVHHAIVFIRLCNILNIDLIFLPPYFPKYNPIEQVWRTIKRPLSIINIESLEKLIEYFGNEFYDLWIDLVFGKVGLKIYYGISKIFNDAYYSYNTYLLL